MKLALPFLFILSAALLDDVIKCDEDVNIPDPPESQNENPGRKDNPPSNSNPSPHEDSGTVEPTVDGNESGGEHKTVGEAIDKPADQPADQPAEQSAKQSTDKPTDGPLTQPTVEVSSKAAAAAVRNPNEIEAKCEQLKDQDGVKITGPCGAKFQVFLVPHVTINVETETNTIYIGKKLNDVIITKKQHKVISSESSPLLQFEENVHSLVNQCTGRRTFKFVVIIKGKELILKWKVYEKMPSTTENNKVDVRTFLLKNTDKPITAIQVHTAKGNEDSFLLESKSYFLKDDMPPKCDLIARNCFLSGNLDIEGCYKCTLLYENTELNSPCFNYLSPDFKQNYEQIKRKTQQEKDPIEVQLATSINKVLQGMYKKGEMGLNELLSFDKADTTLKEELLNYCASMKKVDTSGVLENYELGSEEDVFSNLTNILKNHAGETKSTLQDKLKNPAICLKNANQWVGRKKGLVLPSLSHTHGEGTLSAIATEKEGKKEDKLKGSKKVQTNGYDGVINFLSHEKTNMQSTSFIDSMYCNDEYCNRWKDDTSSCLAKIEPQDQGDCATSWLFASKLHLETIKCMKGYEHVPSSALYVANCSNKETPTDKCHAASNPLEFLHTLEETKFLPTESNLPYSYKAVNNVCPEPKNHWQNLWANVKLLDPQYQPNAVSTKGYTAYQSANFNGNMDAFIKLVKSEIMNKGSVIAYVKAAGALSYDLNGKKVQSLCGSEETPDLAVNIIGYGNYINGEGIKKSYWLLQNSWGKYWGDGGHFKVDMHGPPECQHNFIHTAAVFNVDLPLLENVEKKGPMLYNYYMKSSPDFYNHILYRGVQTEEDREIGISGQDKIISSVVSGQTSAEDTLDSEEQSSVVGEGKGNTTTEGAESTEEAKSPPEAGTDESIETEEQDEQEEEEGDEFEEKGYGEQEEEGDDEFEEEGYDKFEEEGDDEQEVEEDNEPEEEGAEYEEGYTETGKESVETEEPSRVAMSDESSGEMEEPHTMASPSGSVNSTPSSAAPASTRNISLIKVKQIMEVIHIMKHIKSGKLRLGITTYKDDLDLANKHDCSRSYSQDPEKRDECIQFCHDEWNNCKGEASPGYCLTQRRRKNDCFFCYV